MTEYCMVCGAELPVGVLFCPACGSPRPQAPMEPGKKKKVKWWMIVLPLVLVVSLAVVVLWAPLSVRIAPDFVLGKALQKTAEDLGARYVGSPLEAIGKAYDGSGQNTVEMDFLLDYNNAMDMEFSAVIQADRNTKQSVMDLRGTISGKEVGGSYSADLDFYMDQDFMAMRVKQVTGGDYYGIAYDTLGEDLRRNALVYNSLGEDAVLMLEETARIMDETMDTDSVSFTYNEEYMNVLVNKFAEMEPEVSDEEIDVNGDTLKCYNITYVITDQDFAEILDGILDVLEDDEYFRQVFEVSMIYNDAGDTQTWDEYISSCRELVEEYEDGEESANLSFYLYRNRVVALSLYSEDETGEFAIHVILGENSGTDDLHIIFEEDSAENEFTIEITLSTKNEEDMFAETLTWTAEGTESDGTLEIGYDWDRADGNLDISVEFDAEGYDSIDVTMECKLYAEDNRFTIEMPDLFDLASQIDSEFAYQYEGYSLDVQYTIYPGADIDTPDYINLGDLTEEALYDMMMNIYSNYSPNIPS